MAFEAAIRNNMGALLIVAALGLGVGLPRTRHHGQQAPRRRVCQLEPSTRRGLFAAVGLLVAATAALLWWPGFPTAAQDIAAISMFPRAGRRAPQAIRSTSSSAATSEPAYSEPENQQSQCQ